ncbi:MAG: cbb3-type cytochrome c oxidase subunit I, partial [Reyranellaceae bacterium]
MSVADSPSALPDSMTPAQSGIAARALIRLAGEEDQVENVIRAFVIATCFWAIAAFAAGVLIALQLAIPQLNLDLEWTTFGRLRPLHTSAAIFAFGGTALIGSSLYIVQRT